MELIELSWHWFALLFLVAMVAGFCDTLAGGGGLITLPALIASGVPPLLALGTSKLQATAGTATASLMMLVHRKVNLRQIAPLFLLSLVFSVLGTWLILSIDVQLLDLLVPLVLIVIICYFLFVRLPQPEEGQAANKTKVRIHRYFAVPLIGGYDGMIGPGTGSFFVFADVWLCARHLIQATCRAKLLNFASNLASLVVFISAGQFVWQIGLVMIVGQFIGAYGGSRCLFVIPALYLKILIVSLCLLMLLKYFLSAQGYF